MVTDVKNNTEEIKWAVNSGIVQLKDNSSTSFEPNKQLNRLEVIKALYNFGGMSEAVLPNTDQTTFNNYVNKYKSQGIFSDLWVDKFETKFDLDSVWWAYNKGS